MVSLTRPPFSFTLGELCIGQLYVKSSRDGIDFDGIAVLQERDRPAYGRFGPDMADTEPSSSAREAAVGDQRDLAAHALPGQRRRGREHFPHAGAAARTLIANDDDLAFFVGFLLDRLEGVFLPIEAPRRAGKFQVRHARDLHD